MALEGSQEFTTDVAASVADCFATIVDFDRYPKWSSSVEAIKVLKHYPDGLPRQVEFRVNMTIRSLRYVLEYEYEQPERLTWRSVDGDIQSIEGAYTFRRLSAAKTRATCRQAIAVGFWVPGPIRRLLERSALEQSVLEFKQQVETKTSKAATSRKRARPRS